MNETLKLLFDTLYKNGDFETDEVSKALDEVHNDFTSRIKEKTYSIQEDHYNMLMAFMEKVARNAFYIGFNASRNLFGSNINNGSEINE